MWEVILMRKRDFSRSAEVYTVEYRWFLIIACIGYDGNWKSFFVMLEILHEGPCEKARPVCRRENGSMHIPPMETSFSHWNMSLLLQVKNPIIGRIFAGNPNIRFFRCLPNRGVISSLNPPNSHDQNGRTYRLFG